MPSEMARRVRVNRFGPSSVLELEDFDPAIELSCGENDIVVCMKAFGVNPVETYIRNGTYSALPALPYTPGKDGAGIVHSIGSRVDRFKIGDRVWITGSHSGTYAEFSVCPQSGVHQLPDRVDFTQGACLGIPYRTAYRAMKLIGGAKEGESILIHGATGGVGTACIQFAKAMKLHPIIASTSSRHPDVIQRLKDDGADIVTTHGNLNLGTTVDLVIENLANANLGIDLKLLNRGGRIVVVGSRGEVTVDPRDLMRSEGSIRGMMGAGSASDKQEADTQIEMGLETGVLKPRVGTIFSLESIAEAHDEVISHSKGTTGKIVVCI
jgi:NADPH2:quinone reductase